MTAERDTASKAIRYLIYAEVALAELAERADSGLAARLRDEARAAYERLDEEFFPENQKVSRIMDSFMSDRPEAAQ